MLTIRLRRVWRTATCFLPPRQTARVTLWTLVLTSRISTSACRKLFVNVPRGPVTVINRDLTVTSTPSGISSSSVLRMSRICKIVEIRTSYIWLHGVPSSHIHDICRSFVYSESTFDGIPPSAMTNNGTHIESTVLRRASAVSVSVARSPRLL